MQVPHRTADGRWNGNVLATGAGFIGISIGLTRPTLESTGRLATYDSCPGDNDPCTIPKSYSLASWLCSGHMAQQSQYHTGTQARKATCYNKKTGQVSKVTVG